ncbi:MAG: 4Fe-4S binding protein [Mycoplasmoidaceae bacterium]|nr:4Fe-4S binding protein [Mycoplasmoidaceae bacterium]
MSKAVVNKSKCLGCGACTGVCPVGAVAIGSDGKAGVDQSKCVGCGACAGVCPVQAIENK